LQRRSADEDEKEMSEKTGKQHWLHTIGVRYPDPCGDFFAPGILGFPVRRSADNRRNSITIHTEVTTLKVYVVKAPKAVSKVFRIISNTKSQNETAKGKTK
jgi:hypothetical protein